MRGAERKIIVLFRIAHYWFPGLLLFVMVGCTQVMNTVFDFDGDGATDRDDCAPSDPDIHPAADDSYGDGIDQNCDGVDGNAVDQDDDGYSNAVDCDDHDDSIHPDASDILGDDIDQNCDGVDGIAVDQDGDGYSTAVDCDDSSPDVHPGAIEDCSNGIDDDCDNDLDDDDPDCGDGDDDDSADDDDDSDVQLPGDTDGDGYTEEDDCNDSDPAVNPGATEVCDLIDNDCDTSVDEDDAQGAPTWYLDSDGDGYGLESEARVACNQPHGYADYSGDCNDSDPTWHPGAQEPDCTDPNDYNCDGSVGYLDSDNDSFAACADCDDSNALINPSAGEVCNSVDDDCDGQADEAGAVGESTWYLDADGDTWGRANWSSTSCAAPAGFVANQEDCDDLDPATNPDATEICDDGIDNDCEDGDELGDNDSDGSLSPGCGGDDCDDDNAAMHPEAEAELCDGFDNDCNGNLPADEADADGDGYVTCGLLETWHAATLLGEDDCNDADSTAYPGANEICADGIDQDCDGNIDNGCTAGSNVDDDGDNFSEDQGDCDDDDSTVFPGQTELCDSIDSDCDDDLVDEFTDTDGEGMPDCIDLCPTGETGWVSDPVTDHDSDGCQDAVEDLDDDNDSFTDTDEHACGSEPLNANSWPTDTDNDAICDGLDNCPLIMNPSQNNLDGDAQGDACDLDDDNDGLDDEDEDINGNGVLDAGETNPLNPDTDGDSIFDGVDNCPLTPNSNQTDSNGNGVGDACDST